MWAGELDLAESHAHAALRHSGQEGWTPFKSAKITLGSVALARGDTATGRTLLREGLEQQLARLESGSEDSRLYLQAGMVHALLGDRDAAMEALEEAATRGFAGAPWSWAREPAFDSLRDDPRFQRLVERVEAHVEQERAKALEARTQGGS